MKGGSLVSILFASTTMMNLFACGEEKEKYSWHTFYGGNEFENSPSMAMDQAGNLIVLSSSGSFWNGPDGELPINDWNEGANPWGGQFLLKLGEEGTYQWHMFFAGGVGILWSSLTVDDEDNIYVAGASTDWRGPQGQEPLHPHSDPETPEVSNIFVLKFNPNGEYQWHTFLGSAPYTFAWSIKMDGAGNPSVFGCCGGSWSGPDGQPPLNEHGGGEENMCLFKLDPNGEYAWHTFFGGDVFDHGSSHTLDSHGNMYLVGNSSSPWNTTANQSPLNAHMGVDQSDIALIKVGPDGAYQWHTFWGSSESDHASSVVVDAHGDIYLTGGSGLAWDTPSGVAPLQAGSPSAEYHAVIMKFGEDGTYKWHTFYMDTRGDGIGSIVSNNNDRLYLIGQSDSSWEGPNGEQPLNPFSQGRDVIVMQLNSDGDFGWHAFYGAADKDEFGDWASAIVLDPLGNIYVAGLSQNSWKGPDNTSPLHHHSGGDGDIFVLSMED